MVAVVAAAAMGGTGEARSDGRAGAPVPVPILVELFTSEGCSSCPPADEVLARLERTQPVQGAVVVPLAHHVDYWDALGWPDPFGSPRATARQRAYGGNYTPQAIVDGTAEMVGSHAGELESAIAEAAKRPHVPVTIATKTNGDAGEATVGAAAAPAGAEIVVALVQAHARIAVPRGENGGRTLDHTAIVRAMKTGARVTFARPKDVPWSELRVVAFVQDPKTRHVLGSSQAKW